MLEESDEGEQIEMILQSLQMLAVGQASLKDKLALLNKVVEMMSAKCDLFERKIVELTMLEPEEDK